MREITIIEHQKVYYSSKNAPNSLITTNDVTYLQHLEEQQEKAIFTWGRNYFSPQQWVGILKTPCVSIEILPKISESLSPEKVRKILINMLLVAHDIPVRKNVQSSFQQGKTGFLDILVSIFLDLLGKELSKGIVRKYVKNEKNITKVKGSINFTKQINKNAFLHNKFVCTYSLLTNNNVINQIIKFTLMSILKLPISQKNVSKIKKMIMDFDEVDLVKIQLADFEKVVLDRNTKRYKEILDYCKLFFQQKRLNLNNSEETINFMLFDMNKLFEVFIFKMLRKIYSLKVKSQYAKKYLVSSLDGHRKKILLRPDIFLKDDTLGNIVLDTKWKTVKSFAAESDIYQMNAYISSMENISEGILLYPKSSTNDKMVGDYLINSIGDELILKIRTVDLTMTGNFPAFFIHLKTMIGR